MNSKTNCMLFIIIALLGSVKSSHADPELSNQLAITKYTHVGNPITGAKTFNSPDPFARLRALDTESKLGHMNNESADSGLLSDESGASPRPSEKEENLNVPAEETHSTKTNESRLSMPSAKKLLKGLLYFVITSGAQAVPEQCQSNSTALNCYDRGCDCTTSYLELDYDAGRSHCLIDSYRVWGITLGCGLLCLGGCCYKYCKSLKERIENERNPQVDNA